MNLVRVSAVLFVFGITAIFGTRLHAQTRSGIGNTQQSQLGIGAGSASPFGSSGQSPFSQGGQGATQQGRAGQVGGQGVNRNQPRVGGQDGFVGSDSDQLRNQQRDPRQQRGAMFDFAIESLNEMREARRERNAARNQAPPVRVRLRPLFTVTPPSSTDVTLQVRSNLERAMPESSSSTQVTVSGSSATIQGTVKSDYERKLAAKMLSLTPGIYQVENQLTIE